MSSLLAAAQRHARTAALNAFVWNDADALVDVVAAAAAAAAAGGGRAASAAAIAPAAAAAAAAAATLSAKANLCVEGRLTTAGSRMLSGYRAVTTATAVARAAECGAVLVGSTNMDEFGMGSASALSVHGPVRSPFSAPWVLHRMGVAPPPPPPPPSAAAAAGAGGSGGGGGGGDAGGWLVPGGSSGGAAVAVAVGASRFALASDTGGSVRQPAAFCGVVGFKPSYGRVPRWGLVAYASSLDTVGFVTASVRDAARLYAATAGHDERDDTSLRVPRADAGGLPDDPALRAAFLTGDGGDDDDEDADAASGGGRPLAGLRVGIPAEYDVLELRGSGGGGGGGETEADATGGGAEIARFWRRGAELLREAGAEVVPVSLPATPQALASYYVLAPAEASSNLARYDGLRYGHRASASSGPVLGGDAASPLLAQVERTRLEGFGAEVRRRVAHGAFVLSVPGVAGGHYAGALAARERVREDFARVFRRAPAVAEAAIAASPLARANAAGRPAAAPGAGVDVLLAPVAPSLPWLLAEEASRSPEQATRADVLTVPASLAHLPAISVPVGSAPFPSALLEAALAGRSAAEVAALRAPLTRACRLPVGLQLIGRLCDERTLLRVARALERRARVSHVDHLAPL